MGRIRRGIKRQQEKQQQELKKTLNKLTNAQVKLVNALAEDKAFELFEGMEEVIFSAFKEIMRKNRISEKRAERIAKEVKDEIMK